MNRDYVGHDDMMYDVDSGIGNGEGAWGGSCEGTISLKGFGKGIAGGSGSSRGSGDGRGWPDPERQRWL